MFTTRVNPFRCVEVRGNLALRLDQQLRWYGKVRKETKANLEC